MFWRAAIPLLALVLGVASLTFARLTPREPRFEGRPLSAWMDCGSEPAALALHALGRQAVPFILGRVRWEHPRWGYWQRYRAAWQRLPTALRPALPRPKLAAFDEERACAALLEVGPGAAPALLAARSDPNRGVRAAATLTLKLFRERGYRAAGGRNGRK